MVFVLLKASVRCLFILGYLPVFNSEVLRGSWSGTGGLGTVVFQIGRGVGENGGEGEILQHLKTFLILRA